jgi:hypothetical protein
MLMAPEPTTTELVEALKTAGFTPELELLRACLRREEELVPQLLELLATDPHEAYGLAPGSDDPRTMADLHAGHLLLAFREPSALPHFVQIYRDESRHHLLQWFTPWLHHYGAAAVPPLATLLHDRSASSYGRAAATEILSKIGRAFPETREQVVAALQDVLPPPATVESLSTPEEPEEIWTWVARALSELDASVALPHIEALYEAGLIDEAIAGDLQAYRKGFGTAQVEPRPFNLLDTYRYLRRVAAQQAQSEEVTSPTSVSDGTEYERSDPGEPTVRALPKVGRNEPCPCGSGRKYKHCHGKPGR